jgi:hypothetical protein
MHPRQVQATGTGKNKKSWALYEQKIALLSLSCQFLLPVAICALYLYKDRPLLALRMNLSRVSLSFLLISTNLTPIPAGFLSLACA